MNILKEVLKNEVYPALGCTEPIAIAYACSCARKILKDKNIKLIEVITDTGTFKNGFAVSLPNSQNQKGNLIASALGALIDNPDLKYNIFKNLTDEKIKKAKEMIKNNKVKMDIDYTKKDLFIEARLISNNEEAICVLEGGHFNITFLSLNGKILKTKKQKTKEYNYKEILKTMKIKDLVDLANKADKKDLNYIKKGIETNLYASSVGIKLKKVGYNIKQMIEKNIIKDDLLSNAKYITSSATDARMAGETIHVMSSGQSGNQGVVAILVPYLTGKHFNIKEEKILKSIALSHLINSYIKVYLGELSPICGCAVSAGVGASAAIVYQRTEDIKKINDSMNNLISDLGGMLCDGAKSGCALKVASSSDSSIRSALMAIEGLGIKSTEGFIEENAQDTIKNLARITSIGMSSIDSIIIDTMIKKQNKNL